MIQFIRGDLVIFPSFVRAQLSKRKCSILRDFRQVRLEKRDFRQEFSYFIDLSVCTDSTLYFAELYPTKELAREKV